MYIIFFEVTSYRDPLIHILIIINIGYTDPKSVDARFICPIFDVLCPYLPEKILKPLRFGIVHKNVRFSYINIFQIKTKIALLKC